MKKCLFLFAILILSITTLTGCRAVQSSPSESSQSEVVNPIESYDSISKLNDALGFDMIELDPNFGFIAYEYDTIDKSLGQIEYTDVLPQLEETDTTSITTQQTAEPSSDKHVTLRMAQSDEDITGIWGVEYETEDFNGIDVNVGVYQNTVYIGSWVYDNYSYSIAAYNIESGIADAMIDSLTAHILGIDTQTDNN